MFQYFASLRLIRPIAVLAAACAAVPAVAQGDLLVAPTRVVMSASGSQVVLSNIGEKPATYRITLELRRMTPNGDTVDVPESDATPQERAALDMVRYAPRRITLQPNQPQAVRISARPPEGLVDGEYRVHMSFRAIPDVTPVAAPEQGGEAPSAQGLSIRLTPVYGITIPVIVRKGQLEGGATLANPRVEHTGTTSQLHLDLGRIGARSIYGEVRVIAPGRRDPIMLVRGIAIYPEVSARKLVLPVATEQLPLLRGPVRIEYREPAEAGGALIAALDANLR